MEPIYHQEEKLILKPAFLVLHEAGCYDDDAIANGNTNNKVAQTMRAEVATTLHFHLQGDKLLPGTTLWILGFGAMMLCLYGPRL